MNKVLDPKPDLVARRELRKKLDRLRKDRAAESAAVADQIIEIKRAIADTELMRLQTKLRDLLGRHADLANESAAEREAADELHNLTPTEAEAIKRCRAWLNAEFERLRTEDVRNRPLRSATNGAAMRELLPALQSLSDAAPLEVDVVGFVEGLTRPIKERRAFSD
jgi:hypothetical protein